MGITDILLFKDSNSGFLGLKLLALKIKLSVIYWQKWVYSKIAENCNCNSDHASYSKTTRKSRERKRGSLSIEERSDFGDGMVLF